jgi:8-oxo-dGTP pyrophosphatase MutT (NUDIX family)
VADDQPPALAAVARTVSDAPDVIKAAGTLLWRSAANLGAGRRAKAPPPVEVALVHRTRHDDWSLPKGKLDADETFLDGAVREVAEETGFTVEIGDELATTRYRDGKGRKKTVRYWAMTVSGGDFVANDETDELRWLPVGGARALLTYAHDIRVLDSLPV